jgi:hypothetical protein
MAVVAAEQGRAAPGRATEQPQRKFSRGQHQITDARAILAPVYAWFTEGFDTVPLPR